MRSDAPKLRMLAERLLTLEVPSEKPGEGRAASFLVTEKLRQPLSVLAGTAGFQALLSRALALAVEDVFWLKTIHVDAGGSLSGLDNASAQLAPDEIAQGEAILIARLIGLLVTFIGAALTARLLQDVWPEFSPRDLASETEENNG